MGDRNCDYNALGGRGVTGNHAVQDTPGDSGNGRRGEVVDYDSHKTPNGESLKIGCEPARFIGMTFPHEIVSTVSVPGKLTISSRFFDITVECKCDKERCDAMGGIDEIH